jgi:hypothetical protein
MGEFQIRQPLDRFSARAQDVDSMGDSQIRDIRVAVEKRADQVLEQTDRYPSDSTWTPSPSPPMRDNPFRSRRLFCSRNQGSPSGPCSDQTKLEDTIRESVSECYRRHFCRLTRQFCNRFMAIHRNADRALRCTWCAEFLRRLEHDPENGRSVSDQISLKRFQAWRRIRLSTPNSKSPRPLISVLVSPRFAKPAAAARAEIL